MAYLKRTLEAVVQRATEQFPVVMVTGARQMGKTTFLRHLAGQERRYVSLDDPINLALAKDEPKLFFQQFKPPVLIDEIQYAPELLRYIKMDVDEHHMSGQYWLTGSQPFHLMRGVSESLAGRMAVLDLLGLSQYEMRGLADLDQPFLPGAVSLNAKLNQMQPVTLQGVYETMWRGAFPFAYIAGQTFDRELFFRGYLKTYLERDVRDLAQVGDEVAFLRFLRVAAARTGQLLNLADMARDADISPVKAKQWLSILQASGIVYLLAPYHNNLTKRLVKAPKLYFVDTGLCAYLTQWSDANTLASGAMAGAMLETHVVIAILKSYYHHGLEAPLYYYRDKDKKEIDVLIAKDQTIYPIEIKKTASPTKQAVKHFCVLDRFNMKVGRGALVCLAETMMPLTSKVDVVPVNLL